MKEKKERVIDAVAAPKQLWKRVLCRAEE